MKAVQCKEVTKKYGRRTALHGVSFSMEENKIIGLAGRNGAGKTTLLKILAGLLKESDGEAEVYGNRPFNNLLVSANSIYIDDQMNFPTSLTLKEILEEGRRFYHNWDHKLAMNLFDYFGFHPKGHHNELSKGKESTFNMIIGLASRSALTIFDEPTTGMDAAVRKDFYRALLKDYLAYPRTILLSTHHLEEVEDLLEEIIVLQKGNLLLHTSMEDMKSYAVAVSGRNESMPGWMKHKVFLYEEKQGPYEKTIILENDLTTVEKEELKRNGVQLSAVSASDAFVYMTAEANGKGGLDDVFSGHINSGSGQKTSQL
ncbi:ABC transporter ATP-binding protein [Halobacillus kuroshimensis]|uniref:ABC transporter ATP-binding protein n=1 Tax=Halobacillus kuroshimensis TaxID=302481 RepID=A0ABS3DX22_9BACI|nr:ABC transporter ATP-binding protein [Halobacillus kuroshimensis]MBN8235863.1 ABC transporter ATP-binding protein [Halobacillus kuroshimensis]